MKLTLTTAEQDCQSVAAQWKKQYFSDEKWTPVGRNRSSERIHVAILAAGNDPEKIAEAIGNQSWTHPVCKGCDKAVAVAVSIGEYEFVRMCEECLKTALAFMQGAREAMSIQEQTL